MKLPPRIKVFKTRIGFHDVVVATSSKKGALEAWDVSQDLFKSGEAAITDDPADIKVALASIGKAVRLSTPKTRKKAARK